MVDSPTVQSSKRVVVGGLTPYTGAFGKEQLIHLLKRTLFGVKKADVDALAGRPLSQVVDTLLQAEFPPTVLPLRNYSQTTTPDPDPAVPFGSTWVNAAVNGGVARTASLQAWWAGQMLNQERSAYQRTVLFWHNHFAVGFSDLEATQCYDYTRLLMTHAFGNFKDFVRAVTFTPAMLRYLNGDRNVKTAPDENYGRELQELFTVGKGPGSGYTEEDVKAAARVLTGWSSRRAATTADPNKYAWSIVFTANNHDTSDKIFSSFYGRKVIKSTTPNTEANALKEFNDMLDMIMAQREVALHLVRKLYRYFVYYEIDSNAEVNVIAPLADLFIANNWEIKPVLHALFTSDHFYTADVRACFIKSPIEFSIGLAREFNIVFPANNGVSDVANQYLAWSTLVTTRNNAAAAQGQNLGTPPNVAGWSAYYQEPGYYRNWINTDSFPKRLRYADAFFTTTGVSLLNNTRLIVDLLAFTDQFGADAANPNKLLDRLLELIYRAPVTQKFRDYCKNTFLLDNLPDDSYWTEAWMNYKASPTNAMYVNTVSTRLRRLYRFLISNTEYQLS